MAASAPPVTALDVLPLIISGLALIVTVVNVWRTDRRATKAERKSELRATQAEEKAREVLKSSLWFDAVEATVRIMSDPSRDDAGDRFQTLSVRFMALVDSLPNWEGLDSWLSAEAMFGAVLRRQMLESWAGLPGSEQRGKADVMYADWGSGLINNLRHVRNVGYDQAIISRLAHEATSASTSLRAKYGWPEPGADSALRPIDES